MIRDRRRGFTLVEFLTAAFVVGLLVALVLTAVMQARDAARRAQCASNLHHLGIALHQHQEARGTYPVGAGERSCLWNLLPFVGQDPLFKSTIDDRTAAVPIPGLFLCPSDNARKAPLSRFATSYAGNAGSFGRDPVSAWDGAFQSQGLTPHDVTDGLGFTAGLSEWIVGPGQPARPSRLGSIFTLDGDFPATRAGLEAFANACADLTPPPDERSALPFKGSYWFRGRLGHSLYTHALPPNSPSCRAAPDLNAITAGSYHGSAAQVLMLDGSVRAVRDSIAPAVWRALGTRAGAETIAQSQY